MKTMDEESGEILVLRDPLRPFIEMHIRGANPDAYRVVRLDRHESRRLAALILYQAERLGSAWLGPVAESGEEESKSA
ncbi:MAG TPA: hypothetical protein VEW47_11075 [Candidatus Dormibacteraeota bacterium]|nr:hypothetical protein [Candidatus Dormibacteraeota bacterium]